MNPGVPISRSVFFPLNLFLDKRDENRKETREKGTHTCTHRLTVGARKAGRCLGPIWPLTLNPQCIHETDLGGIANMVIIRAHSCELSLPNRA